jgi:hypothetical protein
MTETEDRLYEKQNACRNRTFHSQNAQQDFLCSARHSLDTLQKSEVFTNFCSVIGRHIMVSKIIPLPHERVLCFLNKSNSQKICSVCARHHMSMNFTNRNWEGYYAYSSRVVGKIVPILLIGVRTLTLLRSRHKKPSNSYGSRSTSVWFMIS